MSNPPLSPKFQQTVPAAQVEASFRLNADAYAALVKGMPINGCPKSELEAGFMCGIQHVLAKLRDGFVIG